MLPVAGDLPQSNGARLWAAGDDRAQDAACGVRFWLEDKGYGVIDSPDTPGGCWVHFSAVAVAGYKTLAPGEQVRLEWEEAAQDGYRYRGLRTWPADRPPVDGLDRPDSGGAYSSSLTITTADDPARPGPQPRPSPEL
ncbi:MAG TPA: cold shock domain-containing protein [Mycobacteriales bacterium]|nr:cold shock domain-containing protein [Mycobacteriales bacterium]